MILSDLFLSLILYYGTTQEQSQQTMLEINIFKNYKRKAQLGSNLIVTEYNYTKQGNTNLIQIVI